MSQQLNVDEIVRMSLVHRTAVPAMQLHLSQCMSSHLIMQYSCHQTATKQRQTAILASHAGLASKCCEPFGHAGLPPAQPHRFLDQTAQCSTLATCKTHSKLCAGAEKWMDVRYSHKQLPLGSCYPSCQAPVHAFPVSTCPSS